jgi:hypothetical protein
MTDEPILVKARAIDVRPYAFALWCTVGGSAPFANPIESRRWSEDGQTIWFLLGTHNFHTAQPDEILDLVECTDPISLRLRASDEDQAAFLAKRPTPTKPCDACGGKGKVPA